jgi:MoxR-like ATPase
MTATTSVHEQSRTYGDAFDSIVAAVATAIHGKDQILRHALTCLLAEGHLLLEDVPGVGKTTMAKAFTRALNLQFGRVQFTPDLLPSDVVGSSVWHAETSQLRFIPGPVFSNVLLGDELNRASPKTQSALLEAMEERQVTSDGTSRNLPGPFMVIATQNPHEHHGTFPLPESQLDRFTMRLSIGYPNPDQELALLLEPDHQGSLGRVPMVMDAQRVSEMIAVARRQHCSESVARYVVALSHTSRSHPEVSLGMSPRAALSLLGCARVWSAAQGRSFVTPDDIKELATPVLSHRLILTRAALNGGRSSDSVVAEILQNTAVPRD